MRSKWFAMMLAISLLLTGCTGGGDPSSAADDGGGSSQTTARTETEWGSTDAVLYTYDGEVQAATFCLTGDGSGLRTGGRGVWYRLPGRAGRPDASDPTGSRGLDPDRGGAHHHR